MTRSNYAKPRERHFVDRIRTGATSIESVNSDVTISTITPEELAALNERVDKKYQFGVTKKTVIGYIRDDKEKQKRTIAEVSNNVAKITKEQYLQARSEGKTKADIAKEQGVTTAAVSYWLKKWGIDDPAAEAKAIREYLDVNMPPKKEDLVTTGEIIATRVETPQTDKEEAVDKPEYVTIRVPIQIGQGKLFTKYDPFSLQFDRTDALLNAKIAVQWVINDLQELLGKEDVSEEAQAYVDRLLGA